MHYDFARVKHNLERDLRGCTLTMDQARQLAEIIVMCTDNPKRSHAKGCKCQACYKNEWDDYVNAQQQGRVPIMQHFMDEVNKYYTKISEGETTIESRNRLLPKPK